MCKSYERRGEEVLGFKKSKNCKVMQLLNCLAAQNLRPTACIAPWVTARMTGVEPGRTKNKFCAWYPEPVSSICQRTANNISMEAGKTLKMLC
ncbi:hypothetical protein AAFF_G00305010 [Aldrovandia affinis]|uniref:Uncharacterized protein n=1 Tax=Aldrovandia affinis TaxID=143900 RepID=A0AAD7SPI0_9TELE|nr:hypothetical protein AAFF_G00305010 [Aldrovandia affinis]